MVAAVDDRFRSRALDLLDHCRVVHRPRSDSLEQDRLGSPLDEEALRELGEPLAVVALVVDDRDLLDLQRIQGEVDLEQGLGVVGRYCPEEVRVVSALGELDVRGRRRHDDDAGILVDVHGRLCCAAADVTEDHIDLFRNELGAHVCRHLGLALVVFLENDHLFAHHAAAGVDVVHHELGSIGRRQSVRSKIAAVRPRNSQPDDIIRPRSSCTENKKRRSKHTKNSFHVLPLRVQECACSIFRNLPGRMLRINSIASMILSNCNACIHEQGPQWRAGGLSCMKRGQRRGLNQCHPAWWNTSGKRSGRTIRSWKPGISSSFPCSRFMSRSIRLRV
ncbi:MAG: hypothetical protein BWZ01_03014 [Deltaproteobacteria bacterium ADurb.BinA179]|nr:MAG: hypothetical protein BWZ01_03014 [Deltaproteobacteria bacterium ADurb.BinA179]